MTIEEQAKQWVKDLYIRIAKGEGGYGMDRALMEAYIAGYCKAKEE